MKYEILNVIIEDHPVIKDWLYGYHNYPPYKLAIIEFKPQGSRFPQTYLEKLRWYAEEKTLMLDFRHPTKCGVFKYNAPYPPRYEMQDMWDFIQAIKDILPDYYVKWWENVIS